ncbi:ABC transporter ATP-binding protein [Xanthobacter sp. KR7-225]|uniref:ABC transporter ATP-binding protein n=1 Tax=Xanthobacter sp. KR7-225 TaxID=3156613 RepID=UPI0032B61E9A
MGQQAKPALTTCDEETKPLILFEDVSKSFAGARVAVQNIDLKVAPREFVTLVGPSGCGKSTLLNMVAGIFAPTSGRVLYNGTPVGALNRKVGYMTQADHLLPWRTVSGNIAVPLEIAGLPRRQIKARIDELLALVGLDQFAASYPSQLSGGMRKRVALARLIAGDPDTLLMDEPFGALDAQLRLLLQIELRGLCRRLGKTVLFVTHDIDEAVALADRCAVFTGRPGTIAEYFMIDLPVERNLKSLRFDSKYQKECARLWRRLTPEIARVGTEDEPALLPFAQEATQ